MWLGLWSSNRNKGITTKEHKITVGAVGEAQAGILGTDTEFLKYKEFGVCPQISSFSENWICLDIVMVDVICPAVEFIAGPDDDPN